MTNDTLFELYPWAVNVNKLVRALDFVNAEVKAGRIPEATPAVVKAQYVKLAGLLVEAEPGIEPEERQAVIKAKVEEETEKVRIKKAKTKR